MADRVKEVCADGAGVYIEVEDDDGDKLAIHLSPDEAAEFADKINQARRDALGIT